MFRVRGLDAHLDARLNDDIDAAMESLTPEDGRWLVKIYYLVQDARIRAGNQRRTSAEAGEPHRFVTWTFASLRIIEDQIKKFLLAFSGRYRVGNWLLAQYGVGPVLSAACLTMFDIRRAPAAGNFWSFAGLSPSIVWEKGQKRPYNATLKAIMAYRLGETFVKFSNRDECFYGQLYRQKKQEIAEANERGEFRQYALERAKLFRVGTEARKKLEQGLLPDGQVHARARRWAVKLFIAHLHWVMYEDYFGVAPPQPYAIAHLGHAHVIPPPYWPLDASGDPYPGLGMRHLLVEREPSPAT